MALLINYSIPATGASYANAYFKINNVQITKSTKTAMINAAIYLNQDARTSGLQPINSLSFVCRDSMKAVPGVPNANMPAMPPPPVFVNDPMYTDYFGVPQVTTSNVASAINVDDILITQGYLALAVHPQAESLLANAISV